MTGLCRSGKTAYPDQETAEGALADIRLENGQRGPRKTPCRAYECERCGDWHLTSRTATRRRAA